MALVLMRKKKLFTLNELLVVFAILSALLSLLQPSLKKMKEASLSVLCQNNLYQISRAYATYVEDYSGWLPLLGRNRVNWELASYLELDAAGQYGYTVAVPAPSNIEVTFQNMDLKGTVWECSAYKYEDNNLVEPAAFRGYAVNHNYLGYLDPRMHGNGSTSPANTVVIGDGTDDASVWWHLRYYMLDAAESNYIYERHLLGVNLFWLDGHVSNELWSDIRNGRGSDTRYFFKLKK